MFRNPLVDPYLLGAAAGAGLGATLVFVVRARQHRAAGWSTRCRWPPSSVRWWPCSSPTSSGASFGGSGLTLVLAGVAVAALGTAMQQYLLLRNSDVIKEVYTWISGRVSTATWGDVRLVLPYVVVRSAVLLLHRRHLDVLRVGDEEAATLGSGGAPGAAGRGHRRHARHGGGGERQRPHRVRRHHGAAPRAAGGRLVVPAGAAAEHRRRCVVPHPRRHPRPR